MKGIFFKRPLNIAVEKRVIHFAAQQSRCFTFVLRPFGSRNGVYFSVCVCVGVMVMFVGAALWAALLCM